CAMCAGAISHARIGRVVFGAGDPKGGGVEHGARVFNQSTCHHTPEIYAGLDEERSAMLLKAFFQGRR
ncbi:MAG: nucleoside deaminase, partial [Hyphomicrobium sp.]